LAHGLQEILRIEKEPVWRAVYPASRVRVPDHDLRPAFIIEGHGTTQIVIPLSAQIGYSVARLSHCIAVASQNNRRNPQYPEIPQPS
jgi:hypothetical protein